METNWAGNVKFAATRVHRPSTVDELGEVVASAPRIRALGTGHSFSRIADTTGDLVSLVGLPRSIEIDPDSATVRVSAGLRYGEIATELHEAGWALRNLASLPHICVAGAVATGTHGSGTANLSTAVAALDFIDTEGRARRIDRSHPRHAGSVVSLGTLGIVTHLTLDLIPTFELRQRVYLDVPRERITEALKSAYSVSLFTDWARPGFTQAWVKSTDDRTFDWGRIADAPRHPIDGIPADACTDQLGVPGPWHLRLPHFRLSHTPSSGDELQSEYFVPLDSATAALGALDPLRDRIAEVLQISELRAVAADDLWLSMAYGRDSLAVHFTWKPDTARVTALLPLIEERLAPFHPRPHWGKLFHSAPVYPRQADFASLVDSLDPHGKFRNEFVRPWATPRL
jgi:xylitol oxidase